MRSCDSDIRISPGVKVGSRKSTLVRSTVHAALAVGGELTGCTGDTGSAEILNAFDHRTLEEFQAAFDQNLSAKGSPTCTAGRLEGLVSSKDSEASTDAPANTVARRCVPPKSTT